VNSSREVLVLGASGFLGRHVASLLGSRAVAHSRSATTASAESAVADLTEGDQLLRLLDAQSARVLVNCSALSQPAACEADPLAAQAMNTDLPRALGEWATTAGARVIHVSTDLVFGASKAPAGGFREEDEPAPLCVYGESKAQGERALLEVAPEALVVRLPLLYGDGRGTGRGASEDLFAILERGELARLFRDEWRTPLPVAVAAAALTELCDMDTRGLLHVAGADRVSRLELGRALHACKFHDEDRMERELQGCVRADLGLTPPRPEDTSLCSERARSLLETELPGLTEGVPAALAPA
jgi:dTDP-4-dehydrorhamnose reductase